MDLRCRKGKTYSGRSVAEGRHRSLDGFRPMQRPRSTETRCATAVAVELQWQMGVRGIRSEQKNEEYLVGSIYKEGPPKERKKRGGRKYKLSNYKDASIFGMVIKIKIR